MNLLDFNILIFLLLMRKEEFRCNMIGVVSFNVSLLDMVDIGKVVFINCCRDTNDKTEEGL